MVQSNAIKPMKNGGKVTCEWMEAIVLFPDANFEVILKFRKYLFCKIPLEGFEI